MTKARTSTTTDRPDVYSKITAKIIADLEQGVRTWMRPWNADHAAGRITRPLRHNGIPYKGINVVIWGCKLKPPKFPPRIERARTFPTKGIFGKVGGRDPRQSGLLTQPDIAHQPLFSGKSIHRASAGSRDTSGPIAVYR